MSYRDRGPIGGWLMVGASAGKEEGGYCIPRRCVSQMRNSDATQTWVTIGLNILLYNPLRAQVYLTKSNDSYSHIRDRIFNLSLNFKDIKRHERKSTIHSIQIFRRGNVISLREEFSLKNPSTNATRIVLIIFCRKIIKTPPAASKDKTPTLLT